jgi:hypothetical protein
MESFMKTIPYFSEASRTVRSTLPGEAGLPVVGYSLDFLTKPVAMGLSLYRKYGPVYWINAFA